LGRDGSRAQGLANSASPWLLQSQSGEIDIIKLERGRPARRRAQPERIGVPRTR
jgi:hypothetical protein